MIYEFKKLSIALILVIFCFLAQVWNLPVSTAQTKPLTYPEIITALNTKLPNSVFRTKTQLLEFLVTQIKERKVDKPLTSDLEAILRQAGATNELIVVIKQNSAAPSTPTPTSTPIPTPMPTPKLIAGGVVNGKAINLVKPKYPAPALAVGATGLVNVQVIIDENGNVISAKAVSGHVLLQEVAVAAAKETKFNPTILEGEKVRVSGVIAYNFTITKPSNPQAVNSVGIIFVLIQAGSFLQGSPKSEANRDEDELQYQVTITKQFYIGKYEVTQEQWEKVMGTNPSFFKNCPKCPVENVSWDDVQDFIKRLNQLGDGTYRLPTEAEWEYACRANTTTQFSFGDNESSIGQFAWLSENSQEKTHEVGTKQPNAWGLYDMHGNVWEWVQDWKGNYPGKAVTDPTGAPAGLDKIGRGGSWNFSGRYLRSANRFYYSPKNRYNYLGFRVVREY
jgi:TonB family protein